MKNPSEPERATNLRRFDPDLGQTVFAPMPDSPLRSQATAPRTLPDKPLGCPWCGTTPSVTSRPLKAPVREWTVECIACDAKKYGYAREDAIAAWNRRESPSSPPEISPALIDAVKWLADHFDVQDVNEAEQVDRALTLVSRLRARSASPEPATPELMIAGMPVRVRDDVPPDEIQCWQNGRCVFRLRNVQGNEMLAVAASPERTTAP